MAFAKGITPPMLAVFSAIGLLFWWQPAQASDITGCTVISTGGTYDLSADILDTATARCIEITASNVTLNGNNHLVDGTSVAGSHGIHISGAGTLSNININNVRVLNFESGIYLDGVDSSTVENCVSNENTRVGIELTNSNNNTINNCELRINNFFGALLWGGSENNAVSGGTIRGQGQGIQCGYNLTQANNNIFSGNYIAYNQLGVDIQSCVGTDVFDNEFYGNYIGISLTSAASTTVTRNTVDHYYSDTQDYVCIKLHGSANNLIFDNYFNCQTSNVEISGGGLPSWANDWSVTKEAGPNIMGGPYRCGNFWDDFSGFGNGISANCFSDANSDYLCDDGFAIDAYNADPCPLLYFPDNDGDGVANADDNCPSVANPGQENHDTDLYGDACDNCWYVDNDQTDTNSSCPAQPFASDPLCGDACEPSDTDGDGVPDINDNCPETVNPGQEDDDGDDVGNACDNCLSVENVDQFNWDTDSLGNACDNCWSVDNESQTDTDNDCSAYSTPYTSPTNCGDVCEECPTDPDKLLAGQCGCGTPDIHSDGDGVADCLDQCPYDTSKTEPGACGCGVPDFDFDNDGYLLCQDNCPDIWNPGQEDSDLDGIGNVCDSCPATSSPSGDPDTDGDGVGDSCDNCIDTPNGSSPIAGVCANGPDLGKPCTFNQNCGESPTGFYSCSPLPRGGTCVEGNIGASCAADGACGIDGECSLFQEDSDGDGPGDACDDDDDNDGVPDAVDNCRIVVNPGQADTDGDGIGDDCNGNIDRDGDEWADTLDNCPDFYSPDQTDSNANGMGDACEFDLSVSRVEFVQVIQDEGTTIPLVEGKDTWIRVYFDVGPAGVDLGPVTGTIRFKYANGLPMYTYINGAPQDKVVYPVNALTAPANPDPANKNHTLNFRLPKDWVWPDTPYLSMYFTLNHPTIEDINLLNNSYGPVPYVRVPSKKLKVNFVPVYGTSPIYIDGDPCGVPTTDDFWEMARWVRKVYPIPAIRMWKSGKHFIHYDPTDSVIAGLRVLDYLWWLNFFTDDPTDDMKYFAIVCPEFDPFKADIAKFPSRGKLRTQSVNMDRAATLTAQYSHNGVTRTVGKRVTIADVSARLLSLAITGPASVYENSSAGYTATATWSDNSTSDVTALAAWSDNSASAKFHSPPGTLGALAVGGDQAVTVTATYTHNGVTRGATHDVTIVDVSASLASLVITGPDSVDENNRASYTATAIWSDASTSDVTAQASWSSDFKLAFFIDPGNLFTDDVSSNRPVTLTAQYTHDGVTVSDTHDVTILNVPATLSSLAITGPTSVNENSSASYTATATWSDGSTSDVTTSALWLGNSVILSGASQGGMGAGDEAWAVRRDYDTESTLGGVSMAHELGHTIFGNDAFYEGIPAHVEDDCGAYWPYFHDYPVTSPKALIDLYGFDGSTVYSPSRHYDFMSYSPCAKASGDGKWVSSTMYRRLLNWFGVPAAANALEQSSSSKVSPLSLELEAAVQAYLVASGMLTAEGALVSWNAQQLMLPVGTNDDAGEGPYSIVQVDADGSALFERLFVSGGASSESGPGLMFAEVMPFDPDTAKILIKYEDTVLASVPVSASAPGVTVEFPNGGESLSGVETVTWAAADADGDDLRYDILYSTDGGANWIAIAVDHADTSFEWDTSGVAGTEQGLIRVFASDGVNSGEDISDAVFSVPKKGPEVTILDPADGAVFFSGSTVSFSGAAFDLEDGQLEAGALAWESSLAGMLASGEDISIDDLAAGTHLISLTAEDGDGNQAAGTITITVMTSADSDGDGVGDDADNCLSTHNPGQEDADIDGLGDACDNDDEDGDGYFDYMDNCPQLPNDQSDSDGDLIGDACDNCAAVPNPDQADCDSDDIGNACDDPLPIEEICDGEDNDCDGAIDEGGVALCDDGLFCNGLETCGGFMGCIEGEAVSCRGNDLPEIASCYEVPDGDPLTSDHAAAFSSSCDEDMDACTEGTQTVTSDCDVVQCGAGCDAGSVWQDQCDGDLRHFGGACDLDICSWDYGLENCSSHDGDYPAEPATFREVPIDGEPCDTQLQQQYEYRDYTCGEGACIYESTEQSWVDAGVIDHDPDNDGVCDFEVIFENGFEN